jgi:two-component system sensor histidine kinase VicK
MGSGLGTANRVIQEHGGRIAIDSELNKGTTVTITLPVR